MNASRPTSANESQPVDGASPPEVFTRWTKVVGVSLLLPIGPLCDPTTCSKTQATAPSWTKSGSVAWVALCVAEAHTVLVSWESCHVARMVPLTSGGIGPRLGLK